MEECEDKETTAYPPYDPNLHSFMLSMQVAIIPLIVIASVLVMSSVRLVKQLYTAHDQILNLMCAIDIVKCIFVIPLHMTEGMANTRIFLLCHKQVWFTLDHIAQFIQIASVSFLNLLAFDDFLHVNFTDFYKEKMHVVPINVFSMLLSVMHFFATLIIWSMGFDNVNIKYKKGTVQSISGDLIALYDMLITILSAMIGTFLVIQVRLAISKQPEKRKVFNKITPRLFIVFILCYVPSVPLVFMIFGKPIDTDLTMVLDTMRLLRVLVPLTNGLLISISNPIYNDAFAYFLSTNPLKWKGVQQDVNIKIANRERLKALHVSPNAIVTHYT